LNKILIISFSNIADDPRVSRQIAALAKNHTLTVAGRSGEKLEGIHFIPLIPRRKEIIEKILGVWLLKTGQFSKYYWSLPDVQDALQNISGKQFDLIIANDVETLPLALRIAKGSKVLLDAHEYSPCEYEEKWFWRFFSQRYTAAFLCQEHLSKIDAMMTVCEGIAKKYSQQFNIPQPFVIMNAPYYQNLQPKPCSEHISLIHHGTANSSRKLELMIEIMDYLDERFTLDLMLIEDDSLYLNYLKRKASNHPRIRFISPVKMKDIPINLNLYDIGMYLLPPVNLNSAFALPNKFFEFIQARLAVAIGPSLEMAKYVHKYDCGVVAPDFKPKILAAVLNRLNREQIDEFKQNSHAASKELCFETSEKIFLENIKRMLEN
jgi:hypothetical protein